MHGCGKKVHRRAVRDEHRADVGERVFDFGMHQPKSVHELTTEFFKACATEIIREAGRHRFSTSNRPPDGWDAEICGEEWNAKGMERGLMNDLEFFFRVKCCGEFQHAGLPADLATPATCFGLLDEMRSDAVTGRVFFHLRACIGRGDEVDGIIFCRLLRPTPTEPMLAPAFGVASVGDHQDWGLHAGLRPMTWMSEQRVGKNRITKSTLVAIKLINGRGIKLSELLALPMKFLP